MKKLKRRKPQSSTSTTTKQSEAVISFILQHARTCFFCGKPSILAGAFFPDDSKAFGGFPGKQRMFPYGLCSEHAAEPGIQLKIEARIMAELANRFAYTSVNIDGNGNTKPLVFVRAEVPSMN